MINPSVAIVILNFNGRHHLQQFLPSVLASTYNGKRVIVADNASTDDSVHWLQHHYPNVELIQLSRNHGFAQGYNEALKQVQSDYYVLLNSDVEVTPDWIQPIIKLMQDDPSMAACQPKMLSYSNRQQFEYAGAAGGWIDSLAYPFSRGRVFDECEMDKGQYDHVEKVFWASGAAFFVRAAVYHQLGGFDGSFFAHQEEIDLCWRMQLAGYSVAVCPQSVVYHLGGGTLAKGERKAFLNFRNNLLMAYKNLPPREKIWKLPLRIVLDLVSAVKALVSGDKAFCLGVLKAEWAFIKRIFTDAPATTKPSETARPQGVYGGSVVWSYFIKKKRTFSEIVFDSY